MTGTQFYSDTFLNDEDSCFNPATYSSLLSYESYFFESCSPSPTPCPPQPQYSNQIKGHYCSKTNTFFVLQQVKMEIDAPHQFQDMLSDCALKGFKEPEIDIDAMDPL